MTHRLHVATTYADGYTRHSTTTQPGSAADAHDSLARRWKAARYDHERDRSALRLTRHDTTSSELGPYTEVVTHSEIEGD